METVAPSLLVRVAMRPMTKVLNPLMARFAGRRHLQLAAQLRHTGRKSGRSYVTTVGARWFAHAMRCGVFPLVLALACGGSSSSSSDASNGVPLRS